MPGARRVRGRGALEGGPRSGRAGLAGVGWGLGVEGRATSLARARIARELYEVENIEFIAGNLEEIRLADLGTFDAIFCCGLLYHLPEPWRLVKHFAAVGPGVFFWTHYSTEELAETF